MLIDTVTTKQSLVCIDNKVYIDFGKFVDFIVKFLYFETSFINQ